MYTISNGFDFQGSRVDHPDSLVSGDLGHGLGFYIAMYDGWSVIRRKLYEE